MSFVREIFERGVPTCFACGGRFPSHPSTRGVSFEPSVMQAYWMPIWEAAPVGLYLTQPYPPL